MWCRAACALLLAGCDLVFPIDSKRQQDGPPPPLNCPASYDQVGTLSSQYRIGALSDMLVWADAESACEQDSPNQGTHLVVYETEDERDQVIGAYLASGGIGVENYLWTGVYQTASNGAWESILGSQVMINAADFNTDCFTADPGYPAAVIVHFDCIDYPGYLATWPVSDRASYICECDGRVPTQAP